MHPDIKIQVICDMKQSSLGWYSTILCPLTEVRGPKICSNSQQAKSVEHFSNISDKNLEKQIRGRYASGYQNSGNLW